MWRTCSLGTGGPPIRWQNTGCPPHFTLRGLISSNIFPISKVATGTWARKALQRGEAPRGCDWAPSARDSVSRFPQIARPQRSLRTPPCTPRVLPPACDPSGEGRRGEALPAPLMRKSLSWEAAVLPRPRGRGVPSTGSSGAAACGESPMAGLREDTAVAAANPEGKGAGQGRAAALPLPSPPPPSGPRSRCGRGHVWAPWGNPRLSSPWGEWAEVKASRRRRLW